MVITSGISPAGKGINRSFHFSYKTKLPAHVDKMWTNQAQIQFTFLEIIILKKL